MSARDDFQAKISDSLAEFNKVACWTVLTVPQFRQYLAAHLAGDLLPEEEKTTPAGAAVTPADTDSVDTTQPQFTAVASPVEYGYMIAIRRDPHKTGHVPLALAQLRTGPEWLPERADDLLLSEYGYVTAPGSYWQPIEGGRYGIRLHRAEGGESDA